MSDHEVQTFHGLEVAGRRVRAHSGDEWKMADLRAEVPCTWEDQLLTPIDFLPIALPEPELGTGGAPNDVTGEDLFYLQDSRAYVGNAMSWWREGGGYTCDPSKAEVFTRDEAFKRHSNRSTDFPWPKEYIDRRASLHVDAQRVDRDEALREPTP